MQPIVAALPTQAANEVGQARDAGWKTSGQTYRVASNESFVQMMSAGENVPAADRPGLPKPYAILHVPLRDDRPTDAIRLAGTEPAPTMTVAVANMPEPGSQYAPMGRTMLADSRAQDGLSSETPGPAAETEKPQARPSNEAATTVARQMLTTGRCVGRIAIHYHGDTRSRAEAQHISSRLGSVGPGTIEMHATAASSPRLWCATFRSRMLRLPFRWPKDCEATRPTGVWTIAPAVCTDLSAGRSSYGR
jgi:hypothetical protein